MQGGQESTDAYAQLAAEHTHSMGVSGILLLAAIAWGHSDLDPRQSIPNKWETYTLNVPTETLSRQSRCVSWCRGTLRLR